MSRYTKSQPLTDHVGARIKAHREAAGLSQRGLAALVHGGGLGDGTISHYESGDHGPSLETLVLLAHALGCEPGELLPSRAAISELLGLPAPLQL